MERILINITLRFLYNIFDIIFLLRWHPKQKKIGLFYKLLLMYIYDHPCPSHKYF